MNNFLGNLWIRYEKSLEKVCAENHWNVRRLAIIEVIIVVGLITIFFIEI